jgi:hypothetical protein
MRTRSLLLTLAASAVLPAGCGGGGYGGGNPPPMSLSSVPGESAFVAYLQSSHQNTLTALNGGSTYTLQVNGAATAGTTTFNGSAPAYGTIETLALGKDGVAVANGSSTQYYLLNPYVPLGEVSSTGSPYGVVINPSPLPATFDVGASGALETLTFYHDSTKTTVDASETITYSVTTNTYTALLVCLNSTISGVTAQGTTDGLANGSESDCFTEDASGNVALLSITLTVNGMTLTFR